MELERTRIQADLRGLIDGDVHCDPLRSQLYASDASVYEIPPLGVIRPRHADDVRKCVLYAAENSIPLFPRGAGTGLAGQALGPGLVLDFSRYMRRLVGLDLENRIARVQPGLVLADLNRALANHGLLFGPDPATRSVTTLGSTIAVDTSGSHWPKYGSACDVVESMHVVLANGEEVKLGKHSWREPTDESAQVRRLASEVGQLLYANREVVKNPSWQGVARGCGYRLEKAIDDSTINLAKLQSGAEGTLAVMTEACIRVDPVPEARALVLLFFDRLELAARAAIEAQKDKVSACDIMDRRLLEIARETDPRYERLLPRGSEAMLLIEHQGEEVVEVRQRLMALVNRIIRRAPTTISSRITTDAVERDLYWKLCRRVVPRLYKLKGTSRPLPFVDDIAVAPERLPELLVDIQNILKAERVTATLFGHASHGQIHIRPFLDLNIPDDVVKMQRLSEKLYDRVIQLKGVIAGEHALGLSRSWFARQQLGERYPICRRIKELFDPQGILNPGKLITDAPQRVSDHLRPQVPFASMSSSVQTMRTALDEEIQTEPTHEQETKVKSPFLPILTWEEDVDMSTVAQACNGCGRCRTNASAERMCPMFRIGRDEESSPRAKANAMRAILAGKLPAVTAESDEMKDLADLCFQCHQCRVECPATVDIPKLVTELKAQYVATNGLSWSDFFLTRLDLLSSLGSRFPNVSNWALDNPQLRWLLEKATGITQTRRLPRLTRQPFLRWAARKRLNRPKRSGGRKVLFFVDQYANWHNPMLGRALVLVMQHQNVEVFVPSNQSPSWMAKIAIGDIQRVRKMIQPTIKMLAESVRQGYEIVCIEPSATLCLQHEYLNLIDNEDSRLVAAHTWDAGHYLWDMHENNELELDLAPQSMSLFYHEPCHLRVINRNQPGVKLMNLIPGLNVQTADTGCSGMAGTFGLKRSNYRTSLRIGWGLISKLQQSTAQIGSTECSACKLQMEQGVDKPTIHPIAIMAHAYGLLPEVADWINRPNTGLTVR